MPGAPQRSTERSLADIVRTVTRRSLYMAVRVVGKVVTKPLSSVQPNPWNPNKMSPRIFASLKQGLETDGWLASQALLIWGKDDQGVEKNLIIDGEHRWTLATQLGLKQGPMVFMEGLTESQAKALTVKMNQKRGEFDAVELSELLKDIQGDLNVEDLGLELGFEDEDIMKLIAEASEAVELETGEGTSHKAEAASVQSTTVAGDEVRAADNHVRLVQLFLDKDQHEWLIEKLKQLSAKYKTSNSTETILAALKELTNEPA
jgi:ParB-like chromosome segregation protein Spo0J